MSPSGKKDDDERPFVLGFAEAQTTYQSASQSARVLTEGWVEQQAFCTNCGNDRLTKFANNRPLADFFCSSCNEEFELKSKKGTFGARVANGAYARKIERLNSSTNPNLLLMNYNLEQLSVTDLIVIPKHFFVPSVIQKRNPLRDTAERAGWVGSNILLKDIPRIRKNLHHKARPLSTSTSRASAMEQNSISRARGRRGQGLADGGHALR